MDMRTRVLHDLLDVGATPTHDEEMVLRGDLQLQAHLGVVLWKTLENVQSVHSYLILRLFKHCNALYLLRI